MTIIFRILLYIYTLSIFNATIPRLLYPEQKKTHPLHPLRPDGNCPPAGGFTRSHAITGYPSATTCPQAHAVPSYHHPHKFPPQQTLPRHSAPAGPGHSAIHHAHHTASTQPHPRLGRQGAHYASQAAKGKRYPRLLVLGVRKGGKATLPKLSAAAALASSVVYCS